MNPELTSDVIGVASHDLFSESAQITP